MSKEAWQEKQVIIDEIKEKLEKAQAAIVIDYMGITVAQADEMRRKLREADVDYTVYKNTLAKRAIEGTPYESLGQALEGPSAYRHQLRRCYGSGQSHQWSDRRIQKMEFKAGVIEGELCLMQKAENSHRQDPVKGKPDRKVHGKHPVA